jgi:hypothetical protein
MGIFLLTFFSFFFSLKYGFRLGTFFSGQKNSTNAKILDNPLFFHYGFSRSGQELNNLDLFFNCMHGGRFVTYIYIYIYISFPDQD